MPLRPAAEAGVSPGSRRHLLLQRVRSPQCTARQQLEVPLEPNRCHSHSRGRFKRHGETSADGRLERTLAAHRAPAAVSARTSSRAGGRWRHRSSGWRCSADRISSCDGMGTATSVLACGNSLGACCVPGCPEQFHHTTPRSNFTTPQRIGAQRSCSSRSRQPRAAMDDSSAGTRRQALRGRHTWGPAAECSRVTHPPESAPSRQRGTPSTSSRHLPL